MMLSRPGAGPLVAALAFGAALSVPLPLAARPAPDGFADLAARLLPSVVNVSTTETVSGGGDDDDADDGPSTQSPAPTPAPTQSPGPQASPGSPFEKLFRDFMRDHGGGGAPGGGAAPGGDPAKRRVQSLGSGFVIDPSGLIVTNQHVVKGAEAITVTLQDNTVLKAKVLGHDDRSDLALLKVDPPRPLPAVSFGNSDRVRVGDWVVAIGNPFGLSGTVTAGIVSSRGRSLDNGPYDDFIQTDAPINRGNSGGPLFDTDGAVIGINTAIYSPSGGSIGIGFSIPANEAGPVIDQLRRFGRARRGSIGVRVQDVSDDIARGMGLPAGTAGALVAGTDAGGPAAGAGIRAGDVIERIAGEAVDGRDLPRVVGELAVDRAVPVVVWRDGHERTVTLTVAEFPDQAAPAGTAPNGGSKPAPKPDDGTALPGLGLTVAVLDDAARAKLGIADDDKGAVVVVGVDKAGAAASHGVKPGDVVLQAGGEDAAGPSQLLRRLAEMRRARRPEVALLLQDNDGVRWVILPLGAAPGGPGR